MAAGKDTVDMPTPVAAKSASNKRLIVIVVVGLALLGAVFAGRLVTSKGSSAAPATPAAPAAAPAAPAAGAGPTAAAGTSTAAAAAPKPATVKPGPPPNTTRDPFRSLR